MSVCLYLCLQYFFPRHHVYSHSSWSNALKFCTLLATCKKSLGKEVGVGKRAEGEKETARTVVKKAGKEWVSG